MSWEQRTVYIDMLVQKEETKRQRNRKDEDKSRRDFIWLYFLQTLNEKRFRVCKIMFENTLGINERSVIYWKNDSKHKVDYREQLGLIVNNHTEGVKDRKEILIEL
ncbi:unnamed protein product [Psylliodes chrysocephalus]|uniref:Uncharacterized protein n=1 Tax=Psylliodes chrysocephalus TaxID=3402493 RepID=A0A9P0DEZ3_9CUCU|nr:unnamed protein product [Psylliodes chrysocephala]